MAYEGDEMANRLWNEFFGSGYGHHHQPSFHGHPGDSESGPMHNSYPYPYPYPYPVPSHRPQPSNRSLAEIESRPPPPREQLPQPSRLEITQIESGPPYPVAPPPRQQRRPSRAQQTEIESLQPLPLLQLPPPPTRPPPPPPPSRPPPPPPPTSPPSPPTRPPPPPPPTRPSPPSPPTRQPPPPPPREQHPPLPRREVEIKSGPSSPVAPSSPRQQSRPSRAQQSEIESLPPSPQPSRLATPPPRAAAKPSNKVSGGRQRANQKKSKSICSRRLIISAVLFFIAGIIFFAAFHPQTPSFRLDAVTVYNFNATGAALSYRLDAEFSSHNPNRHIGIHYQRLEAFAVYGPQRITDPRVPLSPADLYQGHKAHIAWPPVVISGDGVQLPAAEQAILAWNRAGGGVRLEIILKGRLKWKVGSWTSTRWHLYVTCPANLLFENPSTGVQIGGGLRFALGESCSVETKINK